MVWHFSLSLDLSAFVKDFGFRMSLLVWYESKLLHLVSYSVPEVEGI